MMRIVFNGIMVLIMLLLFAHICCCAKHNGYYLNKVTTKYITPHLNWAKPLHVERLNAFSYRKTGRNRNC